MTFFGSVHFSDKFILSGIKKKVLESNHESKFLVLQALQNLKKSGPIHFGPDMEDPPIRNTNKWYRHETEDEEILWIQGEHDGEGRLDGRVIQVNADSGELFIDRFSGGLRHGEFTRINTNGTIEIGVMFHDSREGHVVRSFLDTTICHSFYEDDAIDFDRPSVIIQAPVYSNLKFMSEVIPKMMVKMPRSALLTYLALFADKKIFFSNDPNPQKRRVQTWPSLANNREI